MCSREAKLPPAAICACGATFYDCPDDRHEMHSHQHPLGSPNHRWVYNKYNIPDIRYRLKWSTQNNRYVYT